MAVLPTSEASCLLRDTLAVGCISVASDQPSWRNTKQAHFSRRVPMDVLATQCLSCSINEVLTAFIRTQSVRRRLELKFYGIKNRKKGAG